MGGKSALAVTVTIGALVLGCGGGSTDEQLPLEPGATLLLDVDFGSAQNWDRGAVKISSHEEGTLLVRSRTSGWGGWGVQLDLTAENTGAALRGRIGGPLSGLFGGPTVRIEITAPAGTRIDARVIGGPLTVKETAGSVVARGEDHPISISNAADAVEVTTRRGEVRVTGVEGDVRIGSGRGAVSISEVTGSVVARSDYGLLSLEKIGGEVKVEGDRESVQVTDARGAVEVTTEDGPIELTKVAGPVRATSTKGPIRALFSGSPSGRFKTDSGTIHVRFPPESALDLDARTHRGKIRLDATFWLEGELGKREAEGQINGGGELLKLDSRRGSIDIDVP